MPYDPGIQDISGQILAQGMVERSRGISAGIQNFIKGYEQNQQIKQQGIAQFSNILANNPFFQNHINDINSGKVKVPDSVAKALKNYMAKGDVDSYDASLLGTYGVTWAKSAADQAAREQEIQKTELLKQQAARMAQETDFAAADRARQERALLTMSNLGQGVGTGVYRKDVQERMAANPFVKAQMQAIEAGVPMSGGQLAQYVANQQELAAKQAAGPQMTERERSKQTLRDAFIAKEGRSPNPQEEADLLRQAARLGSAAYRGGQSMSDSQGNYIGNAVFDTEKGQLMLAKPDGSVSAIPEGARPATATAMTRDIIPYAEFKKLKGEVTQDEIAIGNLSKYLKTQENTNAGLNRLADKISANVKTLFNTGSLTKQQFAQAYANQQLQGLLGANKLSVVGGGVLTEQDALRVIDRLGGNVDALQNPELVRQAIADIYSNKVRAYKDNVRFYNSAVESYWGKSGKFEPAEMIEIDAGLLEAAAAPTRLGLSPDKAARKRELEAKAAAK